MKLDTRAFGIAAGLVFAVGGRLYNRMVRGGAPKTDSMRMAEQRG